MSAIYNTEPQPTASVILHTNYGEISVELFAKQTPLTSRNFLQRCLDGYYDNTVFHRLVPGFILQGGDPTGSGNGGESIYDGGAFAGDLDPWPMDERKGKNAGPMGINFKDEFHSRLKFNRRGLVGMANEGAPDTNGSQFFFTLDKADELNGKNTLFGRVVGDTIYNLTKMGEVEVEEGGDRPVYALKLDRAEILVNPFADMKKRQRVAPRAVSAPATAKKPKKRKVGKQLLSFGDDEADGEDLPLVKKPKFDSRIVMDLDELDPLPKAKKAAKSATKTGSTKTTKADDARDVPIRTSQQAGETESAENERTQDSPRESPPVAPRIQPRHEDSESPEPVKAPKKTALEKANEEIAALKASMRRNMQSEPAEEVKNKSEFDLMIPETSTRGRKRRPGAHSSAPGITDDEQKTLDLLRAFQSKLEQAPPPSKGGGGKGALAAPSQGLADGEGTSAEADQVRQRAAAEQGEVCDLHFIFNCQSCQAWDKLEDKEESDDEGWMSHALNFTADRLGKDLSFRKKAEEELVVIDPREKARTLQEEKRAKSGTGSGSGRAWDQSRNAQPAKASAVAGRGAR